MNTLIKAIYILAKSRLINMMLIMFLSTSLYSDEISDNLIDYKNLVTQDRVDKVAENINILKRMDERICLGIVAKKMQKALHYFNGSKEMAEDNPNNVYYEEGFIAMSMLTNAYFTSIEASLYAYGACETERLSDSRFDYLYLDKMRSAISRRW